MVTVNVQSSAWEWGLSVRVGVKWTPIVEQLGSRNKVWSVT